MLQRMVLRVFSGDNAGRKARKEFNLMRRLHEVTYPVPEVYSHEETGDTLGKPFILMERIMGKTLDVLIEQKRDKKTDKLTGLSGNYIRVLLDGEDSLKNKIIPVLILQREGNVLIGKT